MLAVVPFHHGCRKFLGVSGHLFQPQRLLQALRSLFVRLPDDTVGVSDFFFCYSVCCRRFGHFSSDCPTALSAFRTFLSAIALLQALRSLFVRLSDGIVGFVIYRHFYAQHPPRLRFNDLETQIGKIKFIAGAGIPPSFSSAKPPTVL